MTTGLLPGVAEVADQRVLQCDEPFGQVFGTASVGNHQIDRLDDEELAGVLEFHGPCCTDCLERASDGHAVRARSDFVEEFVPGRPWNGDVASASRDGDVVETVRHRREPTC